MSRFMPHSLLIAVPLMLVSCATHERPGIIDRGADGGEGDAAPAATNDAAPNDRTPQPTVLAAHQSGVAEESASSDPPRAKSAASIETARRAKSLGPVEASESGADVASAEVRIFSDRRMFDGIGGRPPVVVDFDDLAPGGDLGVARGARDTLDNVAPGGIEFVAGMAPLIVVRGSDTFLGPGYVDVRQPSRHRLVPTSGERLLSPGGEELAAGPTAALEDDDITLVFDPPVSAVGFDLLTPSADGMSFVDVAVIAIDGRVLHAGRVATRGLAAGPGGQWPPPSDDFFGVVSAANDIALVVLDELDQDPVCPDSNIGIDTIAFAPAPTGRAGDLDGDGDIDGDDVAILRAQLGARCAQSSTVVDRPWWLAADLDRDGDVDEHDMAILLAGFGG